MNQKMKEKVQEYENEYPERFIPIKKIIEKYLNGVDQVLDKESRCDFFIPMASIDARKLIRWRGNSAREFLREHAYHQVYVYALDHVEDVLKSSDQDYQWMLRMHITTATHLLAYTFMIPSGKLEAQYGLQGVKPDLHEGIMSTQKLI